MAQAKKQDGPTIKVKGKEYNIEKDFSWRELLTVEELAGMPLGRDDALDSMAVGAAFVFVVLKRENKQLTWEKFLDEKLADVEAPDTPSANGSGSKRPTRAAKAASSPSG